MHLTHIVHTILILALILYRFLFLDHLNCSTHLITLSNLQYITQPLSIRLTIHLMAEYLVVTTAMIETNAMIEKNAKEETRKTVETIKLRRILETIKKTARRWTKKRKRSK